MLQTLVFESAKRIGVLKPDDPEVENVRVLFRKLDSFRRGGDEVGSTGMEQLLSAFIGRRGTFLVGFSQKVYSWIRGVNDSVYKELKQKPKINKPDAVANVYSFPVSGDIVAEDIHVLAMLPVVDIRLAMRAETKSRYMVSMLCRIPILRSHIVSLIGGIANLGRFVALMYSMDINEQKLVDSADTHGTFLQTLSTEDVAGPYPELVNLDLFLYECVRTFGFLNIPENELKTYLANNPTQRKSDASLYPLFEQSVHDYVICILANCEVSIVKEHVELTLAFLDRMAPLSTLAPVRQLDKQDPWKRIETIINSELLWQLQFPYHALLTDLFERSGCDGKRILIS